MPDDNWGSARVDQIWRGRADEIGRDHRVTVSRCEVEVARSNGTFIWLAGPGCPSDFHLQLLRELARPEAAGDDRCVNGTPILTPWQRPLGWRRRGQYHAPPTPWSSS